MLGTIVGWVSFLSTPSARRATARRSVHPQRSRISIHALREEGDANGNTIYDGVEVFLSTPSARRATPESEAEVIANVISIHALREEGDMHLSRGCGCLRISIHALREEGDSKNRDKISIFL